jgi:L-fucose mutarotase
VLKTPLLHPEILQALGRAGHGARVLIADGNYPCSTEAPDGATRVYLNFRRGLLSVSDVLQTLVDTIPIESVLLMAPADGQPVPLHDSLRAMLPSTAAVTWQPRLGFYGEAKSPTTTLVIATGEQRRFANVLLTIGVISANLVGEP